MMCDVYVHAFVHVGDVLGVHVCVGVSCVCRGFMCVCMGFVFVWGVHVCVGGSCERVRGSCE